MLAMRNMRATMIGRKTKLLDIARFRRARSSARAVLLVDADSHSIEQIKEAITSLKGGGGEVETRVFAPPARAENKMWNRFLQEPGITFRPVVRSMDPLQEPNDEAIAAAMQGLSGSSSVEHIALLTSDSGFLSTIIKLKATKPSFVLFVPEGHPRVIRNYADQGLEVVKVRHFAKEAGARVRAILHDNGSGSVQLADPHYGEGTDYGRQEESVMCFLQDLGYRRGKEYLVPACAKFWFVNQLGPLTTFPAQLSTVALYKVISDSSKATGCWMPSCGGLAFFLPIFPTGKTRSCDLKTYGSAWARSIFRGGGPFLLRDSDQLTPSALKRFGYLDDDLNSDEHEAMFCFVNATQNKKNLRKIDLLPDPADRSQDVKEKLRAAFLSHACPGSWQVINKDQAENIALLQQILWREGLLKQLGCSPHDMIKSMKAYMRYQLAPRETFIALAYQIRNHIQKNPTKRSMIHFNR